MIISQAMRTHANSKKKPQKLRSNFSLPWDVISVSQRQGGFLPWVKLHILFKPSAYCKAFFELEAFPGVYISPHLRGSHETYLAGRKNVPRCNQTLHECLQGKPGKSRSMLALCFSTAFGRREFLTICWACIYISLVLLLTTVVHSSV